MQHVIRFSGHINWQGRSAGLPETIYAFLVLEDASPEFIDKMVAGQSEAFIRSQAMYAQREQGKMIDLRVTPQDRMLVPFHNIAFISVDVQPLIGELSAADHEGVERLSNGEEPVKQ